MSVFFLRRGVSKGIKFAHNYALGESVYLRVNNILTEFRVIRQINPDHQTYDNSCDGTWLLSNNIITTMKWADTFCDYENSNIHTFLNTDFYNMLSINAQNAIKEIKIPYIAKTQNSFETMSGQDGLTTKVFILSAAECFQDTTARDGELISSLDTKSYYEEIATSWWTRSISNNLNEDVINISDTDGLLNFNNNYQKELGIRPAIIIPYNTKFYEGSNILKGVM